MDLAERVDRVEAVVAVELPDPALPGLDGEPELRDAVLAGVTEAGLDQFVADPGSLVLLVDEDRQLVFAGVVGDERDVADYPSVVPRDDRRPGEQRLFEPFSHPLLADGWGPLGALGRVEVGVHPRQRVERRPLVRAEPNLPLLAVDELPRRRRIRPFPAGERLPKPADQRRERTSYAFGKRSVLRSSVGHRRLYGP